MNPDQHAKLIVTPEGEPEFTYDLGERVTMGRSTSNMLVINDQNASRRHAEIRHIGGGRFRLSDIGSANGTWLNGRRVTVPRDLDDGDQIVIGNLLIRFVAPEGMQGDHTNDSSVDRTSATGLFATAVALRNEMVVVLVCDIRGYTSMSEILPARDFSKLVADWFKECSDILEKRGGIIDKFIGDAVMVYWIAKDSLNPAEEVDAALTAARELVARAEDFSVRIAALFAGQTFKVGVGMNLGEAIMGNVGTGQNQSFTIVGDSVNVTFRLEALTKEKKVPIILSLDMAKFASKRFRFEDLGKVEVKGRKEPVAIVALDTETETQH